MSISSRVARKPVTVPAGVDVRLADSKLTVKGPKGELQTHIVPGIEVLVGEGTIQVQVMKASARVARAATVARRQKAAAGTARAKIANLVQGVTKGFERKLTLVGVG